MAAPMLGGHDYVGPEYELEGDLDELIENPTDDFSPDDEITNISRPTTSHSLRGRSSRRTKVRDSTSPAQEDDDELDAEPQVASKKPAQARKRAAKTSRPGTADSKAGVKSEKAKARSDVMESVGKGAAVPHAPRYATVWAFPLLVVLSWVIGAVLHTLIDAAVGPGLAAFSRDRSTVNDVVLVLGWKTLELALFWFGGLDDLDTLSLTTLAGVPYFILLDRFYEVSRPHLAFHLLSNIAQNVIPIRLLTRRNPYHTPFPHILRDPIVRLTTTLLGSVVYALPLYFSLTTWLPISLTTHFSGIKTLEHAHAATFFGATLSLIPIGLAARKFLFDPSVHNSAYTSQAVKDWHAAELIDPAHATLRETVEHNVVFWKGMHPRGRVLLYRTMVLTAWTGANATFGAWIEIEGSEIWGAFAWGAIWAVGAALTGATFGWVGSAF